MEKLTEIFKNPLANHSNQVFLLEKVVNDYPYFQSAWSILARNLYVNQAENHEEILAKAAIRTSDREQLYRFLQFDENIHSPAVSELIPEEENKPYLHTGTAETAAEDATSESYSEEAITTDSEESSTQDADNQFIGISSGHFEKESERDIDEVNVEEVGAIGKLPSSLFKENNPEEESQPANNSQNDSLFEEGQEKTSSEPTTMPFTGWLHKVNVRQPSESNQSLQSIDEISKQNVEETEAQQVNEAKEISEKFKIIEEFLEKNPKITPVKEYKAPSSSTPIQAGMTHLMTETLANIYMEQKKYDKAIKAFTILRLKYPEKSGYFADRINEIKDLQNNN